MSQNFGFRFRNMQDSCNFEFCLMDSNNLEKQQFSGPSSSNPTFAPLSQRAVSLSNLRIKYLGDLIPRISQMQAVLRDRWSSRARWRLLLS
jgi:hypothetical protein